MAKNKKTNRDPPTHSLCIEGVLQEVIAFFRWQYICRYGYSSSREEADGCTSSAKVERDIEIPSRDRELVVVVVEVRLIHN